MPDYIEGERAMRVITRIGIGLGGLVALLLLTLGVMYVVVQLRINRTITGVGEPVAVSADAATIAEGRRLVVARGCVDCHGANLGGEVFIDDPMLGRVSATNLTTGAGGIGAVYTAADFERAIRHGVGADGKPLLIMPSHEYYPMSDADVGAIIAYFQNGVAPVDNQLPSSGLGPLGVVLGTLGAIELTPASKIDESAGRDTPPPGATVEYGRYLSVGCTGCHGGNFAGGISPVPGMPLSANLTPDAATGIGGWSEADFIRAMREGVRPDGSAIDPAMPWQNLREMNDTELKALFRYLHSLEPLPEGAPAASK